MATDATGAPTPLGIPKFNTSADAPSGLGSNAQMDAIDTLLAARVVKPSGIVFGEASVWNGTGWDRSSTTKIASGSFAGIKNVDVDGAAAIAYSKMNNPGGTTTFLRADGTFAAPGASGVSVYDRVTAGVDVNTSVAETSIYTKSILANDMSTNKMLRLVAMGDYLHNNVAGDTLTIRVKFGGTTFYAGAMSFDAVADVKRQPWMIDLRVANLGAANSQIILGSALVDRPAAAAPTTGIGSIEYSNSTVATAPWVFGISTLGTIDTTANQTLDVTVQWSASSANNSWRQRYALLELV
jgi:hypothetical protein